MALSEVERTKAQELLDFIDSSPSPWHAGRHIAAALDAAGYSAISESDGWRVLPDRFYVCRGESSLIAFSVGENPLDAPIHLLGAHTDSPNLRVKPSKPLFEMNGQRMLMVEPYGGLQMATFADRELSMAGRAFLAGESAPRMVCLPGVARLSSLAIHLNREVNDKGLRFDAHQEIALLFDYEASDVSSFSRLLGEVLDCDSAAIRSWDLALTDAQPGAFWGVEDSYIADSQLDNLASCHAGLDAFLATQEHPGINVLACFDHEEIGSETEKGANSRFLISSIQRLVQSLGGDSIETGGALLSKSRFLSVDMAHAFHPNFSQAYDETRAPIVNGGPAIKINPNQRYTTDASGQAFFAELCEGAGVPCQVYSHRGSIPCGSTIGPMLAAQTGMQSLDVGNPMWSMHSAREAAGAKDHASIIRVFERYFKR